MFLATAPSRREHFIPLGGVLLLTLLYSTLAIRRHLTFHTAGWDLGIFEQAIRNYASLRAPVSLLKGAGYNLLGDHFHPILVLLVPFYWLAPGAITLLVAQAFLFALAAYPLIRWAQRALGRGAAVAVGLIYGLSFGVASAVGYDFHEIAFAVPLIAFSLSALGAGRLRSAALWAAPLVLVKEDLGVSVVAVIGVLIFVRGCRSVGAALAIFGAVATALEMGVILPLVNAAGGYNYWGRLAAHPLLAVFSASAGEKMVTLLLTFGITAFVALRSPLVWVAVPTLLWRFAVDDANYWGVGYHYSAVLMPVVVAALIEAPSRQQNRGRTRRAVPLQLGVAVIVTVLLLPLFSFAQLTKPGLWDDSARVGALNAALRRIPNNVTVAASDDIVPHLTSRDSVTLFALRPLGTDNPDYIVVDPLSPRHFVVTPERERRALSEAETRGYHVIYRHDHISVLKR